MAALFTIHLRRSDGGSIGDSQFRPIWLEQDKVHYGSAYNQFSFPAKCCFNGKRKQKGISAIYTEHNVLFEQISDMTNSCSFYPFTNTITNYVYTYKYIPFSRSKTFIYYEKAEKLSENSSLITFRITPFYSILSLLLFLFSLSRLKSGIIPATKYYFLFLPECKHIQVN